MDFATPLAHTRCNHGSWRLPRQRHDSSNHSVLARAPHQLRRSRPVPVSTVPDSVPFARRSAHRTTIASPQQHPAPAPRRPHCTSEQPHQIQTLRYLAHRTTRTSQSVRCPRHSALPVMTFARSSFSWMHPPCACHAFAPTHHFAFVRQQFPNLCTSLHSLVRIRPAHPSTTPHSTFNTPQSNRGQLPTLSAHTTALHTPLPSLLDPHHSTSSSLPSSTATPDPPRSSCSRVHRPRTSSLLPPIHFPFRPSDPLWNNASGSPSGKRSLHYRMSARKRLIRLIVAESVRHQYDTIPTPIRPQWVRPASVVQNESAKKHCRRRRTSMSTACSGSLANASARAMYIGCVALRSACVRKDSMCRLHTR